MAGIMKKMLSICTVEDKDKLLTLFLKRHGLTLEQSTIEKIMLTTSSLSEQIETPSSKEESEFFTYLTVVKEVEDLFVENGINVYTKPISWTSQRIRKIDGLSEILNQRIVVALDAVIEAAKQ